MSLCFLSTLLFPFFFEQSTYLILHIQSRLEAHSTFTFDPREIYHRLVPSSTISLFLPRAAIVMPPNRDFDPCPALSAGEQKLLIFSIVCTSTIKGKVSYRQILPNFLFQIHLPYIN